MKKTNLSVLTAITAMGLFCQSCDWTDRHTCASSDITFCTAVYVDSVEALDGRARQSMHVDFPVDEDTTQLAETLVAWLCNEVAENSYPDWVGDWPEAYVDQAEMERAVQDGPSSFAENFVSFYGKKGMERMTGELKNMVADGYEGELINELSIELVEQEKDYLTFVTHHFIYTGGAHGGQRISGVTFRRSDGQQLDWSLFDQEKRAELSELLKKGLMDYFSHYADEPIRTDSALFDNLLLFDDPETPENELEFGIPMPSMAPWLTRNGFVFMYSEYEIAPYAMGHPYCEIPVEAIRPLLNDKGRAWLQSMTLKPAGDTPGIVYEERL